MLRRGRSLSALAFALALLPWSGVAAIADDAAGKAPKCFGRTATIVGTPQRDNINGTNGPDVIVSGKGWDVIDGRGGKDRICAGRGADRLEGGVGDDFLYGGYDSMLYGEDQYGDTLNGGPGDDHIDGGPGLSPNDRGLDVISYAGATSSVMVDLAAGVATIGGSTNTLVSIEYVTGTRYDDVLRGDDYFQTLTGLAGADRIVGLGGVDFLDGGSGPDLIRGGDRPDYVNGGAGDDQVYGESGADLLRGDYDAGSKIGGNDTVRGGAGDDTIYGDPYGTGQGGNDSLYGEAGDDGLYAGTGFDRGFGGPHVNGDICRGVDDPHGCER